MTHPQLVEHRRSSQTSGMGLMYLQKSSIVMLLIFMITEFLLCLQARYEYHILIRQ